MTGQLGLQHAGSHEQDRYDAMVWLQDYSPTGRCKCAKCEKRWAEGDPLETAPG